MLLPVTERPVPQGPALGDSLSPTQPISAAASFMPEEPIQESAMWGINAMDWGGMAIDPIVASDSYGR